MKINSYRWDLGFLSLKDLSEMDTVKKEPLGPGRASVFAEQTRGKDCVCLSPAEDPEVHWSASIAQSVNSKFCDSALSQQLKWRVI